MNRRYLDNGATSFPKAPGVVEAMTDYLNHVGTNVGRGAYLEAFEAHRTLWSLREKLCTLFEAEAPECVIFTANITESLNVLIKGYLGAGDHVLISPMEHNAVLRPLQQLASIGVTYDLLPADNHGRVITEPEVLNPLVNSRTKMVICTHASNVNGAVNDLERLGSWVQSAHLKFVVDAAQTAGLIQVSQKKFKADAIAFTGHKGLLGPQGTGGMCITSAFADVVRPLIVGGTGSHSESEEQPNMLPDKFEAGTPNTVGLYGLHAAVTYIEEAGIDSIYRHEIDLVERLMEGIQQLEQKGHPVYCCGPKSDEVRTGVVSIGFKGPDPSEVSYYLEKQFGIATRVGLHCAPMAHKHMKTFPEGTLRLSVSCFTTHEDIAVAITALEAILTSFE